MRMAKILHLAVESTIEATIMRETKRRVWWTFYMIDRWSAAGLGLSREFHNDCGYPALPMAEAAFHHMKVNESEEIGRIQEPGLWAHMITLVEVFGQIQDLNQHLAKDDLLGEQVESSVVRIADSLETYDQELPSNLRLNYENLVSHARQGVGRTFVALHLGYHHYATLLYFQFLDTQRSNSPNRAAYADRCKQHATAFSDLLRLANNEDGCAAVYNIVAHMTIVSSSVLLHTLLFGEEVELPPARQRLESNFELLIELKGYWPSVRPMVRVQDHYFLDRFFELNLWMDRLSTFQSACFWSATPNTHKVDQWMVKFLLQHALALDEKTESESSPMPLISQFNFPPSDDLRLAERGRFTAHALSDLLI
jgi:hypothetical protein